MRSNFCWDRETWCFVAAKGTHEGGLCVYIDLYRVENLKVVEHWGFPQMVPPQSEWKNTNGML
jgi:predicted SnoaL-like aldol condensation-catalyzing enzyme